MHPPWYPLQWSNIQLVILVSSSPSRVPLYVDIPPPNRAWQSLNSQSLIRKSPVPVALSVSLSCKLPLPMPPPYWDEEQLVNVHPSTITGILYATSDS